MAVHDTVPPGNNKHKICQTKSSKTQQHYINKDNRTCTFPGNCIYSTSLARTLSKSSGLMSSVWMLVGPTMPAQFTIMSSWEKILQNVSKPVRTDASSETSTYNTIVLVTHTNQYTWVTAKINTAWSHEMSVVTTWTHIVFELYTKCVVL